MLDREPQGYKFKHAKQISLDGYHGVAKDLMQLNDPIADGFMRVSDMRDDIVIIQKPQDRVRDYDEIGFVRVAKFLKMPRMEFWHGDGMVETKREDGVWLVAINDQELADRVARSNDGKRKFDDMYVEAFRGEVSRGLTSCLKREKLLNSGKYNLAVYASYKSLLLFDLFLIPVIVGAKVVSGDSPVDIALRTSELYVILNGGYNILNLLSSGMREARDRIVGRIGLPEVPGYELPMPRFNEPFVKHSLLEVIAAPTVPLDRLVRGLNYLSMHGQDLIKASQQNKA
ncbi:hypothetical protein HY383_02240 [Candidatus Daviesbacteria bacterium]|nr:hypothetical protein [Candidatus Daviesbacteria bacterium]